VGASFSVGGSEPGAAVGEKVKTLSNEDGAGVGFVSTLMLTLVAATRNRKKLSSLSMSAVSAESFSTWNQNLCRRVSVFEDSFSSPLEEAFRKRGTALTNGAKRRKSVKVDFMVNIQR